MVVAEDTGDLVHLVSGVAGEDEAPRLIVPNTALILHLIIRFLSFPRLLSHILLYLDVIGVNLLSWKHIECTVIVSPKEDTSSAVMPGKENK